MDGVTFTYPGNTVPTIMDMTVRASMGSRVACVGQNGAGKSTMIKVRQRRDHVGPILSHFSRIFSAPSHVYRALLGGNTDRMLIGACKPTVCPIDVFRC